MGFKPLRSDLKTTLKGSSICTFGGPLYKTKTLAKLVRNRKILFDPVSTSLENGVLRILSYLRVISRQFGRGLCFVLLGGILYKRRPWLKSVKAANLVALCFISVDNHV